MGYTASVRDSTAFKLTYLYLNTSQYSNAEEYLLTNKAYVLERHIITPYK